MEKDSAMRRAHPTSTSSTAGAAAARPILATSRAVELAHRWWGLAATARELPSYADRNFLLDEGATKGSDRRRAVLKLASCTQRGEIDLQVRALQHLEQTAPQLAVPRVIPAADGTTVHTIDDDDGRPCQLWMLSFLPGRAMDALGQYPPELLFEVGRLLATLDRALGTFDHPAARRDEPPFEWDVRHASQVGRRVAAIADPTRRALAEHFFLQFRASAEPRLPRLRHGVIHNDGHIHNLLVSEDGLADEGDRLAGLIDFGDLVESCLVCEPAISAAYAMLGQPDPLAVAAQLLAGYHRELPLTDAEIAVAFPLIGARLAVSVVLAAEFRRQEPDNDYLGSTEEASWELLARLRGVEPAAAEAAIRAACGLPPAVNGHPDGVSAPSPERILAARRHHLAPSLSLSYRRPLHFEHGAGQYLFEPGGRAYLDGVNNVCHVGHCHPRVVAAACEQMARLNTNTRYLYEPLARYSERLTALLPEPLSVCFLVCSGSEANDLALRLARAHTGARGAVVLDGAYHGHTSAVIGLSPYKFNGPGGAGEPADTFTAVMPDPYRGPYPRSDPRAGERYAESVGEAAERARDHGGMAAFFAEPLLGCGGQIEPPPGYLAAAFGHVRAAGGLCVADEVQIGFGRLGSHFWGFETQGVVPDIVTLGKPIGNGHPMAAVVTTPEIARSFANGMEYFNTFGGNPVSCAVGLAVLDVIEEEGLQAHAARVGDQLLEAVGALAEHHPLLGDVRGRGLFLGFELVQNRATLEPAAEAASRVIEHLRGEGILLSTDGPLHNVLKFKPPMVFSAADAVHLVSALDRALALVAAPI